MGIKCRHCFKQIDIEKEIFFCPFCGSPLIQGSTRADEIASKIEAIWGNQGIYAEKIKAISKEVCLSLSSLTEEIPNADTADTCYTEATPTPETMRNRFSSLLEAESESEFEEELLDFLQTLSDIMRERQFLQKTEDIYRKTKTFVTEKMQLFEKAIGLSLQLPDFQNTVSKVSDKSTCIFYGTEHLSRLSDTLLVTFHGIKAGILNHGYISLLNCNYKLGELQQNGACLTVNLQGEKVYNMALLCDILEESSKKDYSDMLDTNFSNHIVCFFEALWLFTECILCLYSGREIETSLGQLRQSLIQWNHHVHVAVDRLKYNQSIDMTQVYLNALDAQRIIADLTGE